METANCSIRGLIRREINQQRIPFAHDMVAAERQTTSNQAFQESRPLSVQSLHMAPGHRILISPQFLACIYASVPTQLCVSNPYAT